MNRLNFISNKLVFAVFACLTLAVYYFTKDAGLIFDFNGWAMLYEKGSYSDVLHSFGYEGLHQVEQFLLFTCYKMFRFNGVGWYLVFSIGHALAATLGYVFIKNWLNACSISNAKLIGIISALLFLLSPLAADPLVNKVSIHYIASLILLNSSLIFLIRYYQKSKMFDFFAFLSCFIIALFTLEISYIYPVIFTVVWFSLGYLNKKLDIKFMLAMIAPFLLLIGLIVLQKLVIGSAVGHYGSDVHLKVDIPTIFSNVVRYLASYIVLFDYWPYHYKEFAGVFAYKYAYLFTVIGLSIWAGLFAFARAKHWLKIQIILIALVIGVLALAPVANLFYTFLLPIKNDRYGYVASLYIYMFIVLVFSLGNRKSVVLILSSFQLVFGSFYLVKNVITFKESADLTWSILDDYKWFNQKTILLNVPDNYGGALLFGTLTDTTSFSESLWLHTGKDERQNIQSPLEMNFIHPEDSVIVTQLDSNLYRVEMAQWGNWFWSDLIGASSYENENFKVTVNREEFKKPSYNLFLKEPAENAVLLYIANGKWQEVK